MASDGTQRNVFATVIPDFFAVLTFAMMRFSGGYNELEDLMVATLGLGGQSRFEMYSVGLNQARIGSDCSAASM